MRLRLVVAFGVLLGCGDDSSGNGGSGATPANCDPSQRTGTYLVQFTTVSGDCGTIASGLVMFGGSTPGETCTLDDQTIDASGCKIDSTVECTATGNISLSEVSALAQDTADGSKLSGEITIDQTAPTACYGTYDVTYTRQ
jgi:hypothetical protein